MIHAFKEILDALDCPGGHIILAIALGMVGVGVTGLAEHYHFAETAKAAATLTGFLQVAGYAMRGTAKANGQGAPPEKSTTAGPVA